MTQHDFDNECCVFTFAMDRATNWKQTYPGSVYRMRLQEAITDARAACDRMEHIINLDRQSQQPG